jgi:hypothetical protein
LFSFGRSYVLALPTQIEVLKYSLMILWNLVVSVVIFPFKIFIDLGLLFLLISLANGLPVRLGDLLMRVRYGTHCYCVWTYLFLYVGMRIPMFGAYIFISLYLPNGLFLMDCFLY